MQARSTPIEPGHDLVVVVDTLVRGVHFPEDTAPRDIGHKALAVNLSDIAAMGGEPLTAGVSLTRETADPDWLADFIAGLEALGTRHGVDVAPALERAGPLCVTVEVVGRVPRGAALRRDGARAQDGIYVTGTLGDAGLALAARDSATGPQAPARSALEARLARPEPRVRTGLALRGLASAAIDVSDGLAADLGHILAASDVGGIIEAQRLPLSDALRGTLAPQRALVLALTAGDDYELCFTVPPGRADALARRAADLDCRVTRIGTIRPGSGLRVVDAEGRAVDASGGYRHFR